ncbi:MAG: hypothetical protein IJK45_08600 [Bacteroidaceae bacterium]|jgi:hypothetical protein|nr:hypothetical protein [Bacteroidaceae bacterium]
MDEIKKKDTEDVKTQRQQQRRRLWGSLFTEGESDANESKSIGDVVRSIKIDGEMFFRQIPLLLLILAGILLMVTNRYQAQQEIIQKEQLQKEVEDWRFRSLTRSSELTTKTRQSQIEERLKAWGDSSITTPKEPPFTINPND